MAANAMAGEHTSTPTVTGEHVLKGGERYSPRAVGMEIYSSSTYTVYSKYCSWEGSVLYKQSVVEPAWGL